MCSRSEIDTEFIPEEINVIDETLNISVKGNHITGQCNFNQVPVEEKNECDY